MSVSYSLFKMLDKISPAKKAYAHCDVPCGIYDTHEALTAAKTVAKMVELIDETDRSNINKITRCIMTKEEHAQKCKHELLVLWTDYFKPEHLKEFPNLHDLFWKAAKLCSKNKQDVDAKSAEALISVVEEISEMFWKTKGENK